MISQLYIEYSPHLECCSWNVVIAASHDYT